MQELLEPELGSLAVDAAQAARRFAADNAALVDRAARLEVPAFETNEVGLPRVVADRYSLAGPRFGPTDWRFLFGAKKAGIVAISLRQGDAPDRGVLTIESRRLGEDMCERHPARARFERIVTGLARQLRSHLDYDGEAGRYQVEIAITPDSLAPKKA